MLHQIAARPRPHPTRPSAQLAASARLARTITWAGSRQSYLIARLLVHKDLQDDCFRAYAYFRWVDDVIDEIARSRDERVTFIERQRELIDRLYRGETVGQLARQERMIADLISRADASDFGLHSFIRNFLAIIEFDAHRKGELVSQEDLSWYSGTLGVAVTDAILHFVGAGRRHPDSASRYLAATAAHLTHMLRDMAEDVAGGYINIPLGHAELQGIRPGEFDTPEFRRWCEGRVALARSYFRAGKEYLNQLEDLRAKLAGHWYCTRFEGVLDEIERTDYALRAELARRKILPSLMRLVSVTFKVIVGHAAKRIRSRVRRGRTSDSRKAIPRFDLP